MKEKIMVVFGVLLILGGLIAYAIKSESTPIDFEKQGERLELHIPHETFFRRFEEQITQSKHYFFGVRRANEEFFMYYRTPGGIPRYYEERLKLQGKVMGEEISYQFTGDLEDERSRKNKVRLLQKLQELCAPEPTDSHPGK